ncbi:MAG: PAS domain S-box protein [Desulfomonilaceae bacterium]|nr:PAS domain S-box protein [Desulfomonilaceae bacterium]
MKIAKIFGSVVVACFVVGLTVLAVLNLQTVYEPELLLPLLSTVFGGFIPILVAYVAAKTYLEGGSRTALAMGCGMLVYGLGMVVGSYEVASNHSLNIGLTIHNSTCFVGAAFHAVGAFSSFAGSSGPAGSTPRMGRRTAVLVSYAGIVLGIFLFWAGVERGWTGTFFDPATGATVLRQIVLGAAVLLYATGFSLFLVQYLLQKSDFFYWYSLGLALNAVGLSAVFLQTAVGSPMGWLGRSAQYVGCIFALVAVITAWKTARTRGSSLESVISSFFAHAEAGYRRLVESASDAIVSFDEEGRIIQWNRAAEETFGLREGEVIGRDFYDVVISRDFHRELEQRIRNSVGGSMEIEAKRGDGRAFPAEISCSSGQLGPRWVATCIIRDITDRRNAEEGIRLLNTTLARKTDELATVLETVAAKNQLLGVVQRAQTKFLSEKRSERVFRDLLDDLLVMTKSSFGFIGELLKAEEGRIYLRDRAISDIAWDDESQATYRKLAEDKTTHLEHIRGLWGSVILTGKAVISNDPENDSRRSGVPAGHPMLRSFLGIPFQSDGELVGMAGIANRPGGYDERIVEFLQPYAATCAHIIGAGRIETDRRVAEQELAKARADLEIVIEEYTLVEESRRKALETAETLEKMFSSTHYCMVLLDRNLDFVRVNQAYADACGYPPEFFPGKNHFHLYPNEENETIFKGVVNSGTPFTVYAKPFEFPGDPDRGITYWDWSLYPVKDADARVEGLVFVLLDVTERIRAEQAVRESESRFQLVTETIQDVFWMSRPGITEMLYVSPAYEELWGRSVQSLYAAPQSFIEAVHFDDVEALRTVFQDSHRTGKKYSCEYRIVRPDGSIRWILERGFPIFDDHGNLTLMCGVCSDITKRKSIEETLRESEERFRAIFDQGPLGMTVMNHKCRFLKVNRAFGSITGYSEADLLDRAVVEITHPDDVLANAALFGKLKAGEIPQYSIETRCIGKTGDPVWVNLTASLLSGRKGERQFLGILEDISERRHMQDLLQKRAGELARSNEDLEQFAYVASHDLQEPLRNVASCLQLLEKKYKHNLGTDADQYIRYAVDSAVRMKALIQDLLAYSRIATTGKPPERIDCEHILDLTLKNLRSAITEAGAVITHDPLPTIVGDDTQLLQAFQNIVQNAVKFRRDEPPRIHVSSVKGVNEWIFSVKDNGIGIESRHLDQIFVIFRQLHKRNQYKGTGMGLAIVKKVIERHGGRVWAESDPGKGTTFCFTIPENGMQP